MHYKKCLIKYIKNKTQKMKRGQPVLTNFTVPHSSNEFCLYWNKKNGYEPQKPPTQGKPIYNKRRNMQLLKGI